MKQVYRVLAFLVAAGVAIQAASIAYAMFALIKWIEGGGTPRSVHGTHARADFRGMPPVAFSSSQPFRSSF
jgi:hypothetical protein